MPDQEFAIKLTDISKEYASDEIITKVLFHINLSVRHGEFVAIKGPSGSGKSTLLNILGLLDIATTGTYILNKIDVTKLTEDEQSDIRNREIGFVFQSFNLLKRITVLENVIMPSIYRGTEPEVRIARAKEILKSVGREEQRNKRPNQLSGGQQQRVAIARALMNKPAIILADEPTGNLDSKSGADIMAILKDLNKEGNTIIMITHDKAIASNASRSVSISDGRLS
ncbi:ABC transporter ATP-binding protein [soil metagenome]